MPTKLENTPKLQFNVVRHIENATECKKIALRAFLDIKEAFDRASFDVIT
jgi:hypothetical protein